MSTEQIELDKVVQQELLRGIRKFFLEERDEEISDFQAANLLDVLLREAGPYIYNQAIADAQALMSRKSEDLFELQKKISARNR